jgi:CRP-like cAMP-binding protein
MVGMCKAAYLMYSYRESIAYGYNALQIRSNMKLPPGIPDPGFLPDIYLYDLIGAGYKKLGAADSSIYFYHQLLAQLNKVDADSQTVELWTAIANGNIGENLVAKQEYDKAFPLLQQWLDMATKYGDNNNICLAKQALAQYYAGKKDHIHAITLWKDVFSFGRSNSNYDYAKKGAEGIYFSYRVTGPADSAFYYADQLLMYRDSFTNRINQSGLQAIQTKIRFENLQYSLETTTASLKQEKRSRNLILAGIAMLAVIAILSYSRQQLKAKNKLQWTAQRQKEAESEARQAKKQIESFVSHIMEKNELIDQLKEKITTDEALQARQDINESLSSYTLISDEEWEKFRADFSRAYPLFLSILANHLPQITPAEERMSTLIFLRFSNQQIANTLGIGKESVTRAKHRLRQRLQLTKEDSLENYICNILKDNNL